VDELIEVIFNITLNVKFGIVLHGGVSFSGFVCRSHSGVGSCRRQTYE